MTSLALAPVPTPAESALAQLHELRGTLAETTALDDVMGAVKRADAIRSWARVARLGSEVAFEAGELHVRAQRRAGELLLEYVDAAGTTMHWDPELPRTHARSTMPKGSLDELGVDAKHSYRWQQLARIPGDEFEARIQACRDAGRSPASEPFLRAAHRFLLPRRSRTSPTLVLLRKAVVAMREVRKLLTPAEIAAAREIARIGAGWLAQLDSQERTVRADARSVRSTSCLLCGREAPYPKPDRCPACNGGWFTA